jgi:hypothetical protein
MRKLKQASKSFDVGFKGRASAPEKMKCLFE